MVTYTRVDSAIRIVLKSCGFKKKSPIHSFRHTVAMRMLRAGIPVHAVAQQLGDTIETIVRSYLRPELPALSDIDRAYTQESGKCQDVAKETEGFGGSGDKEPEGIAHK